MNTPYNEPLVTVSQAVDRFVNIYDPAPGDLVAIKRAFTDFSVGVYHKREKHWLRSCHSYLEKVLRSKWRNREKGS